MNNMDDTDTAEIDLGGRYFDFMQTGDEDAFVMSSQTLNVPSCYPCTTSPTSSDSSHLAGMLDSSKTSGGSPLLSVSSAGDMSSLTGLGSVQREGSLRISVSGSNIGDCLNVGDAAYTNTQNFSVGTGPWPFTEGSGIDDESYSSYNGSSRTIADLSPLADHSLYTSPQHSWVSWNADSFDDNSSQIMSTYSLSPQIFYRPEECDIGVPGIRDVGSDPSLFPPSTDSMVTAWQAMQNVEQANLQLPPPMKDSKTVRFANTAAGAKLPQVVMTSCDDSVISSMDSTRSVRSMSSTTSKRSTSTVGTGRNKGDGADGHKRDRGSSISSNTRKAHAKSGGKNKEFACDRQDCSKPVFTRMADLERHIRHIHLDADKKECFLCDYISCSRSAQPFHRKDHYREHLRENHKEDLLKRGSNANRSTSPRHHGTHNHSHPYDVSSTSDDYKKTKKQLQETQLQSSKTDASWWRCARCLKRVDIAKRGWTCPDCKGSIEEPRKAIRQSRIITDQASAATWGRYIDISMEAYQ